MPPGAKRLGDRLGRRCGGLLRGEARPLERRRRLGAAGGQVGDTPGGGRGRRACGGGTLGRRWALLRRAVRTLVRCAGRPRGCGRGGMVGMVEVRRRDVTPAVGAERRRGQRDPRTQGEKGDRGKAERAGGPSGFRMLRPHDPSVGCDRKHTYIPLPPMSMPVPAGVATRGAADRAIGAEDAAVSGARFHDGAAGGAVPEVQAGVARHLPRRDDATRGAGDAHGDRGPGHGFAVSRRWERKSPAEWGRATGRPIVCPQSHWSDLNRRPLDYESRALPLSYSGRSSDALARIRTATPFGTTPSR